MWQYTGEVDSKNRICGQGSLCYLVKNSKQKAMEFGYFDYTGTFLNGKFHGIGS